MTADRSILSKIEALLAKASRTDNEHEAAAFYEKAQSLMIQHAVDEQMLRGATSGIELTRRRIARMEAKLASMPL